MKKILFLLLVVVVIVACQKILPGAPALDETLDGPIEGLTMEQNARFLSGDIAFNDEILPKKGAWDHYLWLIPVVLAMQVMARGLPLPH